MKKMRVPALSKKWKKWKNWGPPHPQRNERNERNNINEWIESAHTFKEMKEIVSVHIGSLGWPRPIWNSSPYSQRLHCLKQNRQGFRPLRKEKPTVAALTRLSLSHSGGQFRFVINSYFLIGLIAKWLLWQLLNS